MPEESIASPHGEEIKAELENIVIEKEELDEELVDELDEELDEDPPLPGPGELAQPDKTASKTTPDNITGKERFFNLNSIKITPIKKITP